MLLSWLGLGVIVIGLLNVAKSLVRSSSRSTHSTIGSAAIPLAYDGVDTATSTGGSVDFGLSGHPEAAVLPPPIARRSA